LNIVVVRASLLALKKPVEYCCCASILACTKKTLSDGIEYFIKLQAGSM